MRGARWPNGLERWLGLATGRFPAGFESHCGNLASKLHGNSVYPALPVSFGGDTKSRRSLLSGVDYAGSKSSHQLCDQAALEVQCVSGPTPSGEWNV